MKQFLKDSSNVLVGIAKIAFLIGLVVYIFDGSNNPGSRAVGAVMLLGVFAYSEWEAVKQRDENMLARVLLLQEQVEQLKATVEWQLSRPEFDRVMRKFGSHATGPQPPDGAQPQRD